MEGKGDGEGVVRRLSAGRSGVQCPSVNLLRGADVVGSSGEGSDDTVLGGVGGAGRVLALKVSGGGLFRVDKDVEEGYGSVRRGVFYGKVEVFIEGFEEGEVGFCVVSASGGSTGVVNEVGIGRERGRVRQLRLSQGLNLCKSDTVKPRFSAPFGGKENSALNRGTR
jgi:hypothetical protein